MRTIETPQDSPLADPPSTRELEEQLSAMGEELRRCLTPVAQEVSGRVLRPSRLVSQLKVDKSLASRLLRALGAKSPLELVHVIPSPTGLGIFLDAAEAYGTDHARIARARDAVVAFQNAVDEFPGGRAALDAFISEGATEVRRRAEHAAKQSVFRAMSYLLGFHCQTISTALILQPSPDGRSVDGIDVSLRDGMRRLRPSAPVAVFSVNLDLMKRQGSGPYFEPLGEPPSTTDPMAFFLPRFCRPTKPAVVTYPQEHHTIFALSDEAASLHQPVTIASALVVRGAWVRYRSETQEEDGRSYLLHYPCKLLVRDLYLRDDLYPGADPQVRLEFPDPTGPARPRSQALPPQLNTLDVAAPVEQLGTGLSKMSAAGIPDHARLLEHVFEKAGWDPQRFRGYRTRIQYPVPMITMGWWIPLPPRPR